MNLFLNAVVKYCKDTQVKCTALQTETEDYTEEISDGMLVNLPMQVYIIIIDFLTDQCALMALRCLAIIFSPMKTKNIPYILQIVPVSGL